MLEVSAVNRLLAAAFCIWKAVVELLVPDLTTTDPLLPVPAPLPACKVIPPPAPVVLAFEPAILKALPAPLVAASTTLIVAPNVPVNDNPFVAVPAVLVRLSRLVVVPPAPFLVMARPLVWIPEVFVRLMFWASPVELLVTLRPRAAPAWMILAAVAAVPLVPLTVKPVTLFVVGVTVLAAVVVGTCSK
jgi:hypothetical protein